MDKIYHLGLSKKQLQGSKIAFVPGDPARVPVIAEKIGNKPVKLAQNREFNTFGYVPGSYLLCSVILLFCVFGDPFHPFHKEKS